MLHHYKKKGLSVFLMLICNLTWRTVNQETVQWSSQPVIYKMNITRSQLISQMTSSSDCLSPTSPKKKKQKNKFFSPFLQVQFDPASCTSAVVWLEEPIKGSQPHLRPWVLFGNKRATVGVDILYVHKAKGAHVWAYTIHLFKVITKHFNHGRRYLLFSGPPPWAAVVHSSSSNGNSAQKACVAVPL